MPPELFLQTDVALESLTTFGLVSRARFYVRITRPEQLRLLALQPELAGLPRLVLGGGSNVILTEDFPGVVIHMAIKGRSLLGQDEQFNYVRAEAGEVWHDFVAWTLEQGWGGLENLSLIPGSVGAAPIQNIGAYGVEIKDCFHALTWYEFATGEVHTLTDCRFAYRDSIFKHALRDLGIILSVTFALPRSWQPRLGYGDVARALAEISHPDAQDISRAICAIRLAKLPDPKITGNAGSFFKNPLVSAERRDALLQQYPGLVSYPQADGQYKLAAGWLIEQAGWKGRAIGQAAVYEKQALVLINSGGATGRDVVALSQAIRLDVLARFGVQLEVEPVFV